MKTFMARNSLLHLHGEWAVYSSNLMDAVYKVIPSENLEGALSPVEVFGMGDSKEDIKYFLRSIEKIFRDSEEDYSLYGGVFRGSVVFFSCYGEKYSRVYRNLEGFDLSLKEKTAIFKWWKEVKPGIPSAYFYFQTLKGGRPRKPSGFRR